MKKEQDFWIANENTKEVLKELMFDANKVKLLTKYQRLFQKVSLKPKDYLRYSTVIFMELLTAL
jgi:hypothetical protein